MDTSPLNCLQELAPKGEHYPWRVMVTCILLNQTHGRQVRPIFDRVWDLLPTPESVLSMSVDRSAQLQDLLRPLGFVNRRTHAIYRNAFDYTRGVPWHKCYGIGKYGRDALDIFVHGRTDVEPTDTWLKPYLEWRRNGGPCVNWRSQ